MVNRRSSFRQSDVEKVLKAYRSAGFSAPVIIIESERITAKPVEAAADTAPNEWDEVLR